jgi:tripartite-type tricarboxylate transporter receptor subunit TctC
MLRTARLLGIACALSAAPALAQTGPAQPIRWISPFAPGGGADFTSRAIAQKLGPALGQQVLIDNRGGAGGMVGVDLAAKSARRGVSRSS